MKTFFVLLTLTLLTSSALATEVIMEVAGRKIVVNNDDRFPCDCPCMRRKLDVKYGGRYTIDSWKCDLDGVRPPGGGGEDHDISVTFFIAEYESPIEVQAEYAELIDILTSEGQSIFITFSVSED